jgi:uncharacterized protein YraI
MKRRTLVATGAAVLAVGVGAGAASANISGDYASNGVYIRTGHSTGYTAVGEGYPGQKATIDKVCLSGQNINGNSWWDHNRDVATGKVGWSADYYMNWFSGSAPTGC